MADNLKVTITPQDSLRITKTPQDNLLVTNYRVFQGSQVRLAEIFDVNIENPQDGDLLQYSADTTQWIASNELKNAVLSGDIVLEGGDF